MDLAVHKNQGTERDASLPHSSAPAHRTPHHPQLHLLNIPGSPPALALPLLLTATSSLALLQCDHVLPDSKPRNGSHLIWSNPRLLSLSYMALPAPLTSSPLLCCSLWLRTGRLAAPRNGPHFTARLSSRLCPTWTSIPPNIPPSWFLRTHGLCSDSPPQRVLP